MAVACDRLCLLGGHRAVIVSGQAVDKGVKEHVGIDMGNYTNQEGGDRPSMVGINSRPGNVRRSVLEVTVRNSAVLQELTFQKTQLLGELSRLLPDQNIRDLRFRIGPME